MWSMYRKMDEEKNVLKINLLRFAWNSPNIARPLSADSSILTLQRLQIFFNSFPKARVWRIYTEYIYKRNQNKQKNINPNTASILSER